MNARRHLSLLDATCIMVGIVVGSGIFRTPSDVADRSGSTQVFLLMWLAGGAASLLGALCFAEWCTQFPEDGGSYAFLRRAFGTRTAFMFAWTDFWIVRPSNLGLVAITLADYAQKIYPLGPHGPLIYAIAAVTVATGPHLLGIHQGRWSQNVLSIGKILGLLVVIAIGLCMRPIGEQQVSTLAPQNLDYGSAFVLVMFCYGGWSDLSYVAAEVKSPERNLLRALALGVAVVTAIYLLANVSFIAALGYSGVAHSEAVAADVVATRLGDVGGDLLSALVVVACFSSLSSMIFTGARVYFALGRDDARFKWLGGWDETRHTPRFSLLAQAALCSLLLMATSLTGDRFSQTFERLVIFNGPCYWGFSLITVAGLFVVRRTYTSKNIGYRIPFFPWLPIVFLAVCSLLVGSSINYMAKHWEIEGAYCVAVIGIGLMAANWRTKESADHRQP